MDYSAQVVAPADAYSRVRDASLKKINGSVLALILKAVWGGWFAGLGGHAALVLASCFYESGKTLGASKAAFGLVFSPALTAILFTGSDLFTGNTMSFTILLYERRVNVLKYLFRMAVSLLGNYVGAVVSALVLTGGTGYFIPGIGPGNAYMKVVADFKKSQTFWRVICSAVGCNCYVCLAVWSSYVTCDSAGNLMSTIMFIGSFAVAGFEHIVANMYTLHAAWVSNTGLTFVDVYIRNLLPTFIGNLIAGCIVIALPLFLLFGQTEAAERSELKDGV